MGLLKFTKTYSASDDGSSITGAELGQLQTDLAAILNGGISNVNVASDAAIAESKLAFDTTSGHFHDGVTSRVLGAGGQRGFIQGAELEYVAADQVKAQSGTIEIAGTFYTRTSYSTTIDTDTAGHWVEGASQRGTSKLVHVYAYNDSGSTYDIKYWLQAPQYANTGTDDSSVKIYRSSGGVWYRYLGTVLLNATGSGNIEIFYQDNNRYIFDSPYGNANLRVLNAATSAAFSDVDCSAIVPDIIRSVDICGICTGAGAALWVRKNGSSATSGYPLAIGANADFNQDDIPIDSSGIFEYKIAANNVTMYVKGWKISTR